MKKGASHMAPETECPFPKRKRLLFLGAAAIFLIACLLGITGVRWILDDPDVPLLISEKGAGWIRFREPSELKSRRPQILTTFFRTEFHVGELSGEQVLTIRAMKRTIVWLDGQIIFESDAQIKEWKKAFQVDISAKLNPGKHEIRIAVMNQDGHPALIAYCEALGIATGEHWEATQDGKNWKPALSVHARQHPIECYRYFHLNQSLKEGSTPLPLKFDRADRAFISKAHVFLPIFMLIFILTLLLSRKERPAWLNSFVITSGGVRWIVLTAWICLAINNMGKMPLYAGMDWSEHLKYIEYVASTWRIPLATEGWQMFQPPLYYFLSAILYKALVPILSWENVLVLLRIVPMACGVLQVELCWRALRYAFPGREDLQIMGTLVGGLLPMNLYISQVIGNEPLAGCLSAVVVVLVIRYLKSPVPNTWRAFAIIGLFLGLAMLTKVTAVLLVPPVLLAITYGGLAGHDRVKRGLIDVVKRIGVVLGVAFLVTGWYYIRNYLEMGRFFIGGWDASRTIVWWQDPGYRTPEQFYTFGESLFYPAYSAVTGIWDSLYSTFWMDGFLSGVCIYDFRPPWNYGFMLAGAWFALLPLAAIALGALASIVKPLREEKRVAFFCTLCVGIYLFAILYLFLIVPVYSTGKATYALGIVPCFAVLCAEGLNILTSKPLLKALLYGIIACWAFASYATYVII
jgi:hypothetical protein